MKSKLIIVVLVVACFFSVTLSALSPPKGWPNYLAMGSITDNTMDKHPGQDFTSFTSFSKRPVNAIFKYEGTGLPNDIKINFPLYTVGAINEANELTKVYQKAGSLPDNAPVIPVMVIYTVNMSYGSPTADFIFTNMESHFIKLIMSAKELETNKIGTVVLNPDFLGSVQQHPSLVDKINTQLNGNSGDIQTALKNAVTYVEQNCTYNYKDLPTGDRRQGWQQKTYTGTVNGLYHDLFKNCSYGFWNAAQDWALLRKQEKFIIKDKGDTGHFTIPAVDNNLSGWITATNWIMHTFAPNIAFGWQENLWAVGTSSWIHSEQSIIEIAKQMSDEIKRLSAYTGSYKPDFLVFDRYEFDDFNFSKDGQIWKLGYLYNARDWKRYLDFVGQMSKDLDNIPVMLWQIPGGHMQIDGDLDKRNKNGGTAPNFFFCKTHGNIDPINYKTLNSYISTISLPPKIYGPDKIIPYLQIHPDGSKSKPYTWDKGHLQAAADENVFAILWGGGNTTGVAKLPINIEKTGDDGGWLSTRIIEYYKNPIPNEL